MDPDKHTLKRPTDKPISDELDEREAKTSCDFERADDATNLRSPVVEPINRLEQTIKRDVDNALIDSTPVQSDNNPPESPLTLARPLTTELDSSTTLLGDTRLLDTKPKTASESPTLAHQQVTALSHQAVTALAKTQPARLDDTLKVKPEKTRGSSVFANLERRIAEDYKDKKILKERFVLLKTLGEGGMGNVYLAKDLLREEMEDEHSLIAIKVLNDECRQLPGALQALQQEAKKAQTLRQANIVAVYDFDRDGDTAFITMEYIEGQSLKEFLHEHRRMPVEKVMYVIERVARGLAYAHQQGYAHADIKPANIFLAKNDTVKILDFGIARAFTEVNKSKRSAADDLLEGAMTLAYASYEMLQGKAPLPADDVFALAIMAYELIRGHHPFVGADGKAVPADIARHELMRPETLQNVPRKYRAAIMRGLAFDRHQRFQNAGQFLDAIKTRNIKKDLSMVAAAACITGLLIWAGYTTVENVVPSVDSLKPELVNVIKSIHEADEFLASQELDVAHNLYSQAWELANDLTANDLPERKKTRAILKDRMNQISQALIHKSEDKTLDEYQLRELYVALDFMAKDDIIENKNPLKKALIQLDKRLQKP